MTSKHGLGGRLSSPEACRICKGSKPKTVRPFLAAPGMDEFWRVVLDRRAVIAYPVHPSPVCVVLSPSAQSLSRPSRWVLYVYRLYSLTLPSLLYTPPANQGHAQRLRHSKQTATLTTGVIRGITLYINTIRAEIVIWDAKHGNFPWSNFITIVKTVINLTNLFMPRDLFDKFFWTYDTVCSPMQQVTQYNSVTLSAAPLKHQEVDTPLLRRASLQWILSRVWPETSPLFHRECLQGWKKGI